MPYLELASDAKHGIGTAVLAAGGWALAALLWVNGYQLHTQATKAQSNAAQSEAVAADWKRKAAKAYTAYLHSEAHGGSVIQLPAGSTFACVDTPSGRRCDMQTVFPPADY